MISNLTCQHCGKTFEAEIVDKTEFCPHCGKETAIQVAPPSLPGYGHSDAEIHVRSHARVLTGLAVTLMCLAFILMVAGVAFYSNDPKQAAAVWLWSIGGGMAGAAAWLYLVAQIVHIRANTMK